MITPDDVRAKIMRQYPAFLRGWVRGEVFVPLRLPAGAPPTDYRALQNAVARLLDGARSSGYRVETQTRQTRAMGAQSLPVAVVIDTADDFLALCAKRREFAQFRADVALIRAALPQLESWIHDHVQQVVEQTGAWPELLRVCTYFVDTPRSDLYIRELPIKVHSKFIEMHTGVLRQLLDALLSPERITINETRFERRYGLRYDEPLVRARLLDPALFWRFGGVLSDVNVPISQFAALDLRDHRFVIVENKMTFLTLPPLRNTIALFGGGFAIELLKDVMWLHQCSLLYWGDLDAQGFQILARLRSFLPQTTSVMMDETTLAAFHPFAVAGTPCPVTMLPQLTPAEHAVFTQLAQTNTRLEQERIDQVFAVAQLVAASERF